MNVHVGAVQRSKNGSRDTNRPITSVQRLRNGTGGGDGRCIQRVVGGEPHRFEWPFSRSLTVPVYDVGFQIRGHSRLITSKETDFENAALRP